jgi:hypothetical protein
MVLRQLRAMAVACGFGVILFGMPAESKACHLFDCLFGSCCGARTTYSPPYVAAPMYAPAPAVGCGSCCAPQTCCYAPPVTYRAFYRPAWTYQANLVPYASYRVVYSNPCTTGCAPCMTGCAPCASGCSPCGAGGCGAGGCGVSSYVSPGCSSCGVPAAPAPTYAPPVMAPAQPSPSNMGFPPPGAPLTVPPAGAPVTTGPPATEGGPAVTVPIPDGSTPPKTFDNGRNLPAPTAPPAGTGIRPNSTSAPAWAPPDRTASRPVQQATYFQLIDSPPKTVPVHQVGIDDGGWRPSHD